MGNYLSAEWYRIWHKRSNQLLFIGFPSIVIVLNILVKQSVNISNFFMMDDIDFFVTGMYLLTNLFLCIIFFISSMVSIDSDLSLSLYSRGVEHGVRRETIFFSKVVLGFVIGFIYIVTMMITHIIMTRLLFGWNEGMTAILKVRLVVLLLEIPSLLFFSVLATLLIGNIRLSIGSGVLYYLVGVQSFLFLREIRQRLLAAIISFLLRIHPVIIFQELTFALNEKVIEQVMRSGKMIFPDISRLYFNLCGSFILSILLVVLGIAIYRRRDFS